MQTSCIWFQPEHISAVTDPGAEHLWPDYMNTSNSNSSHSCCWSGHRHHCLWRWWHGAIV